MAPPILAWLYPKSHFQAQKPKSTSKASILFPYQAKSRFIGSYSMASSISLQPHNMAIHASYHTKRHKIPFPNIAPYLPPTKPTRTQRPDPVHVPSLSSTRL